MSPQIWTPPRVLSPVQTMISVRAGRSSFTAFRLAVARFAPRLLFFFAGRRVIAGPGANVAVGARLEPLDGIGVVHEAGAEEMGEERRGRVAGNRDRCRHDAASVVAMMESDGGAPSPGHPAAAPASGHTLALGGEGLGRSAIADGRRSMRTAGSAAALSNLAELTRTTQEAGPIEKPHRVL